MSSKSKKIEKGCVGFFYNGIISKGKVVICLTEERDPKYIYEQRVPLYGNGLMFKYISCPNPDEVFGKFQNDMKNTSINNYIYSGHIESTEAILKKVSGEKVAHLFPKRTNKHTEDETEKETKSKSKVQKDDSEDEAKDDAEDDEVEKEVSDKKSKKKDMKETKSKSKVKRDESEDETKEDETDEVEVPKIQKNKVKKGKSEDETNQNEADDADKDSDEESDKKKTVEPLKKVKKPTQKDEKVKRSTKSK